MDTSNFSAAIISSDERLTEAFAKQLGKFSSMDSMECIPDYSSAHALRLNAVDLLLIDCSDLTEALHVIQCAREQAREIEIIAICAESLTVLSALMRAGVHAYIPVSDPDRNCHDVLQASIRKLYARRRSPRTDGDIIAFLPGKPGSGSSTIAANTAWQASKLTEGRIILVDFDRDAPVQAFLNRLRPQYFLQHALRKSHEMDNRTWSRIVSQCGDLDVLPSEADNTMESSSSQTRHLIHFIRRTYDLACIDLPGSLDPASNEVLTAAKRVYLTCTLELSSIHVSMRKAELLKSLGLEKKLRLLVNRFVDDPILTEQRVSELVGLPVEAVFPNNYQLANASAEAGSHVDPATPLGESYTKLARISLSPKIEAPHQRAALEFPMVSIRR